MNIGLGLMRRRRGSVLAPLTVNGTTAHISAYFDKGRYWRGGVEMDFADIFTLTGGTWDNGLVLNHSASLNFKIAGADNGLSSMPTGVSFVYKGLVTFADNDGNPEVRYLYWLADGSNRMLHYLVTAGATDRGRITGVNTASGTGHTVAAGAGGNYDIGTDVPFSIAHRHTSDGGGAINYAADGVAGTAVTGVSALANLSGTDMVLCDTFVGTIQEFHLFDADIGDSGIASVTT